MSRRAGFDPTVPELGITLLRVVAGIVFFMHGWQKLVDNGVDGTTQFFAMQGIPSANLAAVVVTIVELVGGAALILGVLTRIVAALLAIDMIVASLVVHLENGFFVSNNGFELTLLLLTSVVVLIISGPGSFAGDQLFLERARSAGGARRRLS